MTLNIAGACAEVARWFALRAQKHADLIIRAAKEDAARANAAAEWWHDVQLWLDGADTWANLKAQRERRLSNSLQPRRPT